MTLACYFVSLLHWSGHLRSLERKKASHLCSVPWVCTCCGKANLWHFLNKSKTSLTLFLCAQNYFRRHAPCESAPYGISPEVMDTYVKSCGMDITKHTVPVTQNRNCLVFFFNLSYPVQFNDKYYCNLSYTTCYGFDSLK